MPSESRHEAGARVRGFAPIPAAVAGMIIWAAHFFVVYATNAVACARGLEGAELFGWPLVPALVLGATALALAAVGVVGFRAWRRLGFALSGQEGEDDPQFLVWLTVAVALLAALAILWAGVPVLIVRACG